LLVLELLDRDPPSLLETPQASVYELRAAPTRHRVGKPASGYQNMCSGSWAGNRRGHVLTCRERGLEGPEHGLVLIGSTLFLAPRGLLRRDIERYPVLAAPERDRHRESGCQVALLVYELQLILAVSGQGQP
jgi:hypothetical protein